MKKIGLALSGGAALGAAHIGVIKALNQKNVKPQYIAGTSIGAFTAAFYAFEKSIEEMQEVAEKLDWLEISAFSLSKYGLLTNQKMTALIEEHIGNKNIEDSPIPLAIVATDICSGKKVVITKGNLAEAIVASTCLPGIFSPVSHNNKMLVDGGLVENLPVSTVKSMGAEFVIASDLNGNNSLTKPQNILEVLVNSFQIIMLASSRGQAKKADLLIQPDLTEFNSTDTTKAKQLIAQGNKAANHQLSQL